MIISDPPIAS